MPVAVIATPTWRTSQYFCRAGWTWSAWMSKALSARTTPARTSPSRARRTKRDDAAALHDRQDQDGHEHTDDGELVHVGGGPATCRDAAQHDAGERQRQPEPGVDRAIPLRPPRTGPVRSAPRSRRPRWRDAHPQQQSLRDVLLRTVGDPRARSTLYAMSATVNAGSTPPSEQDKSHRCSWRGLSPAWPRGAAGVAVRAVRVSVRASALCDEGWRPTSSPTRRTRGGSDHCTTVRPVRGGARGGAGTRTARWRARRTRAARTRARTAARGRAAGPRQRTGHPSNVRAAPSRRAGQQGHTRPSTTRVTGLPWSSRSCVIRASSSA